MCFSSAISFGAGAALLTAGVATVRRTSVPGQIPLASIPLVFAAQQISEGLLWESIQHDSWVNLRIPMTYLFIVFAQIIWPLILSFALYKIETEGWRRKVLFVLSILGLLTSIFRTYTLSEFGVSATVINDHISYNIDRVSSYTKYGVAVYFLTTAIPFLFSSISRMWIMGVLIIASYFVTLLLYKESLLSVWCFFAAIISVGLFFIIRNLNSIGQRQDVMAK